MASIQSIIEILYFGLIDYVPESKLIDYKNEFSSRKRHNTKFALSFFPKYIDFDKAIKKPKYPYDTLLLNYWIVEVPNNGLKWSKLISDYEYEKSIIINQHIRSERNNVKTKTKLLLTKKQKEERRKKKLGLSKEPVLHGEVIRRIKTDPEYAAKIKAIAKKNSEKKLNYTERLQAIEQKKLLIFLTEEQQEPLEESVKAQASKKNTPYSTEQSGNPRMKSVEEAQEYLAHISKRGDKLLKVREELSKPPLSSKEICDLTNHHWAAHGKANPNKPLSKEKKKASVWFLLGLVLFAIFWFCLIFFTVLKLHSWWFL